MHHFTSQNVLFTLNFAVETLELKHFGNYETRLVGFEGREPCIRVTLGVRVSHSKNADYVNKQQPLGTKSK